MTCSDHRLFNILLKYSLYNDWEHSAWADPKLKLENQLVHCL